MKHHGVLYRFRMWCDLAASVVAIAFALLVSGLSLWWLVLSSAPPIRSTGGDHAVTRDVRPGGELLVSRSFCVDKPPNCIVSRSIVNAKVQQLAPVDGPTEPGCFSNKVYSVEIPGFTEGGPHFYRETLRCIINPAVTKVVVMPDVPFNVVMSPPKKR